MERILKLVIDGRFRPSVTLLLASLLALSDLAQAQTSEPMAFTTAEGIELGATLTLPADLTRPVPVVLLIAGSGPTDRNGNSGPLLKANVYAMLADSLARRGVAMLRYDKRLSGKNIAQAIRKINIAIFRFDQYATDALGFLRQLQTDRRFSRVLVAGHSEGSLVGMLVAQQEPVAAYISLAGAGRNIADILKVQFDTAIPEADRAPAGRMLDSLRAQQRAKTVPKSLLSMGFLPVYQPLMMSWMQYDPAVEITRIKAPVLLVQGKRDIQVAVTEVELLKKARPDATLLFFAQMSHILKDAPEDREANAKTYADPNLPLTAGLAEAIATFAKRANGRTARTIRGR
jgi:uncharacterized protein